MYVTQSFAYANETAKNMCSFKRIHVTKSNVRICLTKTKGVYTFRPTLSQTNVTVIVTDAVVTSMTL